MKMELNTYWTLEKIEDITKEIDDNNKKIKTLKSDEQINQIKSINKNLMDRRSELKKEIEKLKPQQEQK